MRIEVSIIVCLLIAFSANSPFAEQQDIFSETCMQICMDINDGWGGFCGNILKRTNNFTDTTQIIEGLVLSGQNVFYYENGRSPKTDEFLSFLYIPPEHITDRRIIDFIETHKPECPYYFRQRDPSLNALYSKALFNTVRFQRPMRLSAAIDWWDEEENNIDIYDLWELFGKVWGSVISMAKMTSKQIWECAEYYYEETGEYPQSGQFNDASTENSNWNSLGLDIDEPSYRMRFTYKMINDNRGFRVFADPSNSWDESFRNISPIFVDSNGKVTGGLWW